MEKNKIQSKGMRTLSQEEINSISGGAWWIVIPVIGGAIIEATIRIFNHKKDPQGRLHDDYDR